MTDRTAAPSPLDALRREADAIEAGIQGIAGDSPVDRQALETRIAGLCEQATKLPAKDAHLFAERLAEILAALDAAAARIEAFRQAHDSGSRALTGKRAASAYGSALDRRRRKL